MNSALRNHATSRLHLLKRPMTISDNRIDLAPGLSISRIVTGLWQVADMERGGETLDPDAAAEGLADYVKAGLTTFDMADHYGSAEIIAGRLANRHADGPVQCLTKWVPEPGGTSEEDVRAAVALALDRLETDRLDLLQYHGWNYADPSYLDDLYILDELKREGLIAHLGLTNFDTAHLRVVLDAGIDVVSNQVSFSLIDQRAAGEMGRLCKERGVGILAYGTLAGGFLTERWLGQAEPSIDDLQTWSQMKYKRFIDEAGGWALFQDLLAALSATAQSLGVSMANAASRFILEQPAVAAVIIGARPGLGEHLQDNGRILSMAPPEESWEELKKALAAMIPVPGDCGDEYRKPPYLTASGDLSHHIDKLPPPYPTRTGDDGRTLALSGTVWEDLAGFSRATRRGQRIFVSGTTATHGDRVIGSGSPMAQTDFIIDKLEGALQSLGGRLEDVVRTRIFIRNIDDWEPVSRAHGRRFGHVQPANTLVRADLVGDDYLVEMEADAIVGDG